MSYKLALSCAAMIGLLALSTRASAAIIVIDTFEDPSAEDSFNLSVSRNTATDTEDTQGPGILGNDRDSKLTRLAPPAGTSSTPTSTTTINPPVKAVDYTNTSSARSRLELTWDGNGTNGLDNSNSLDGVDLTDGGTNTALVIQMLFTDGLLDFKFTIADEAGHIATVTKQPGMTYPSAFVFNFSEFLTNNSNLDLTSVKSVKLSVEAVNNGADATFAFIRASTVPEPTTLALLGMAVLPMGIGAWRRSRRSPVTAA